MSTDDHAEEIEVQRAAGDGALNIFLDGEFPFFIILRNVRIQFSTYPESNKSLYIT